MASIKKKRVLTVPDSKGEKDN